MVFSKNCEICSEIKFEIENVQHLRQKLWAENFEPKILSEFKLNKMKTMKSKITTLKNEQWKSDDQENKIKTTLIINYLFYLHNNWYVEVKCQIEWMDGKAGLQQSKNLVTASMGKWMNG